MDITLGVTPFANVADPTQMLLTSFGATFLVRTQGAQTGNGVAVLEWTFPAGRGFPMHIHRREDELLYLLEGTLILVLGDDRSAVGPGTFIYGPRNVPHGFRASDAGPVRFVETFLPSGLEQYFIETSQPNTDQGRAAMTAAAAAVTPDVVLKQMAKYGIEIVGPVPA
jgi:quercetin dioxygenase-like cupin family protein